jgi:hypothetical protein
VLQVWPISTLIPLESKRRQNTLNNTDWNVSCYCNSKLPKTYTWSGTSILKDRRYTFTFFPCLRKLLCFLPISSRSKPIRRNFHPQNSLKFWQNLVLDCTQSHAIWRRRRHFLFLSHLSRPSPSDICFFFSLPWFKSTTVDSIACCLPLGVVLLDLLLIMHQYDVVHDLYG